MRPANAELADRASTPPRFATWVRVVVLALFLSASLGWSAAAVAEAVKQPNAAPGGEGVFEPIDAEALIGACAAAAAERDATNNEYKIAYVKCLREAIIEQHSALIADHLKFAEREGADMEEQRRYWRGRAEWLADEARSCIPSCGTVDLFGRPILDRAVEVGEAVLRDFVAERNVYEDGARRFSERDDASDLGPACWDISDNMRDTGIVTMMRWGIVRTVRCIEYVILDQVEVAFDPKHLSRQDMREKLDDIRNAYGSFYWSLYNELRDCDCDVSFNTYHLRAYAALLQEMLRDVTRQRQKYGP